jgi:hypothetical protein
LFSDEIAIRIFTILNLIVRSREFAIFIGFDGLVDRIALEEKNWNFCYPKNIHGLGPNPARDNRFRAVIDDELCSLDARPTMGLRSWIAHTLYLFGLCFKKQKHRATPKGRAETTIQIHSG